MHSQYQTQTPCTCVCDAVYVHVYTYQVLRYSYNCHVTHVMYGCCTCNLFLGFYTCLHTSCIPSPTTCTCTHSFIYPHMLCLMPAVERIYHSHTDVALFFSWRKSCRYSSRDTFVHTQYLGIHIHISSYNVHVTHVMYGCCTCVVFLGFYTCVLCVVPLASRTLCCMFIHISSYTYVYMLFLSV